MVNRSTDNLIGTAIVQEAAADAKGHRASAEVGGMMVHPAARGFGIATLLLQVVMVHELRARRHDPSEAFVAHVVDGNQGPIHSLLSAGFEDGARSSFAPTTSMPAIANTIPEGASGVPMHCYRFDPKSLDHLMHVLWRFVHEDRRLLGNDAHGHAEVDFSDMLDPAGIDADIDDLRAAAARRDREARNTSPGQKRGRSRPRSAPAPCAPCAANARIDGKSGIITPDPPARPSPGSRARTARPENS